MQSTPTGTRYTKCKASAVAADNLAVLDPINKWLQANSHAARLPLQPGTVTSSDGVAGVAKGDDCGFGIEPFIGLFISSYRSSAVSQTVVWAGLDSDEIDTNKEGSVVYLHAADWSVASGGAEVNFPGVTDGKTLESVFGAANKFLLCKLN